MNPVFDYGGATAWAIGVWTAVYNTPILALSDYNKYDRPGKLGRLGEPIRWRATCQLQSP